MNEQTVQADMNESAVAAPAKKPAAKKKRGRPKAKKAAAKKPAAKKAKKAKKSTAKKSTARKAKKGGAKKSSAKKSTAKKSTARKAKKGGAKKSSAKKSTARKSTKRRASKAKKPNDGAAVNRKGFTTTASSQYEQAASSFNAGVENLSQAFMSYAQEQMEDAVSTAQQLLNCRSLEDMATVQTQYVQQSFDRLVKRANKMTQTAATLAKDASSPLSNQMEAFAQRFSRAA